MLYKTQDYKFNPECSDKEILAKARAELSLRSDDNIFIFNKSVDARRKNSVVISASFLIETSAKLALKEHDSQINIFDTLQKRRSNKRIVIAGSGPCGLFCALYLAKAGLKPIIIERGEDLPQRAVTVENFVKNAVLDEETNVQFGLGGAGAFSDGKLNTNIRDERIYSIMKSLVNLGAPQEIQYLKTPHAGTDNLRKIIPLLRDEIIRFGGEFRFKSRLTDIIVKNGRLTGVEINGKYADADNLVIACGHSARDIFSVCARINMQMEIKPFSVGVRIEHSADFINSAQLGSFSNIKNITPADYKLVSHAGDRTVYSFCMCPGGTVVPSASEKGGIVTNGMSNYARDGINSNSALLANVLKTDFDSQNPLRAIDYQRSLERSAYSVTDSYKAPCQNAKDFVNGKKSGKFVLEPSYSLGAVSCDINSILPHEITESLKAALEDFNGKIKGFCDNGVLTAVESRSTSPIRLLRGENFESNIKGIYPSGEGAGYAGGIISSAVDGIKTAEKIADR